MNCIECGHAMMAQKQYEKATVAERAGRRRHRGRGLCSACQARARRAGTLIDYERATLAKDEFVEEVYMLVFDRGVKTFKDLGTALGMTSDGVGQGLRVAARAGNEKAALIRSRLPVRKACDPKGSAA